MLLEKLHFYIALLAGIITTAFNIYIGAGLVDTIGRLILALCLFYVLGYIALFYTRKKILKPEEVPPDGEEGGEEDEMSGEPTLMEDDTFEPAYDNDMFSTDAGRNDDMNMFQSADDGFNMPPHIDDDFNLPPPPLPVDDSFNVFPPPPIGGADDEAQ